MLTCIVQSACNCGENCKATEEVPAIVIIFAPKSDDKEALEKALESLKDRQESPVKTIKATADEAISIGTSIGDMLRMFLTYQQLQGIAKTMMEGSPLTVDPHTKTDDAPFTEVGEVESFLDTKS